MSLLKVKQIAAPANSSGATIIVGPDGKVSWSSTLTSALVLPTGSSAERPTQLVPGSIRFNSETQKAEIYNGTEWKEVGSGAGGGSGDRINNETDTTFVDTVQVENHVIAGAFGKTVLEITASETEATAGEKVTVTNIDNEVQMRVSNTAATGDVDLRLIPQGSGHVYLGVTGDGIVEAEAEFDLVVRGGKSTGPNGGDLILTGGEGSGATSNGGNVLIAPGKALDTGSAGIVRVDDANDNPVLSFASAGTGNANYLEIENGVMDLADIVKNSVKIRANALSASGNVDMHLGTKGTGLVRVEGYSAYMNALGATGNNDALVTKGYVAQLMGGETGIVTAGVGLTDDNGTFNVNLAADTVKVDATGNLIVASNATDGHILTSTGTTGQQAVWGPLNLANTNSFAGALSPARGGTGLAEYNVGDLLVGGETNSLSTLAVGTNGQILIIDNGIPAYEFPTKLTDANGELTLQIEDHVINGNAWFTMTAAMDDDNVVLGVAGNRPDIGMTIATVGTGLIHAVSGYTDNIIPASSKETIITKGYLEAALSGSSETLTRRATLNADWSSTMNIGEPTPVTSGGFNLYVTRVMLQVVSPITGGGVASANIQANGIAMDISENDITEAGIYLVDLPQSFVSQETQITINFFQANGTTPATPTGGEVVVTANYVIR